MSRFTSSIPAERLVSGHAADALEDRDEMWEGARVVSPIANFEHQTIVSELTAYLTLLIRGPGLGRVFAGCNVSDRELGWTWNYRIPDVAVYLNDGVGRILDAHSVGGPDFLVEVLSEDEPAVEKLPFYARVGVREALYVRRSPWTLELYGRTGEELVLKGRSRAEDSTPLVCASIPVDFRMIEGEERPRIEVTGRGGEYWMI